MMLKNSKINTVIALKLDRLSRSIYDWENLLKTSEKYGFDLVCANDDINTTTANGKKVIFQQFVLLVLNELIKN